MPSEDAAGPLQVIASPLTTLDGARANAAESWRAGFEKIVRDAGGAVHHLPLLRCSGESDFEVPLGWTLSQVSRHYMDGKVGRLLSHTPQPATMG